MLHTYFGTVADARKDEKEGWIFPCDAELPDFFIRFGDGKGRYTARIPGAYVEFGPSYSGEDGSKSVAILVPGHTERYDC